MTMPSPSRSGREKRGLGWLSIAAGVLLLGLLIVQGQRAQQEGNDQLRNDILFTLVSPVVFLVVGFKLLSGTSKASPQDRGTNTPKLRSSLQAVQRLKDQSNLELQQWQNSQTEAITSLRQELKDSKAAVVRLQSQLSESVSYQHDQRQILQTSQEAIEQRSEALIKTLEQTMHQNQEKQHVLTAQLSALQQELDALKQNQTSDHLQGQVDLLAQLENIQPDLRQLQATALALQSEEKSIVNNLKKQQQQGSNQVEALRVQIEVSKSQLHDLQQQLLRVADLQQQSLQTFEADLSDVRIAGVELGSSDSADSECIEQHHALQLSQLDPLIGLIAQAVERSQDADSRLTSLEESSLCQQQALRQSILEQVNRQFEQLNTSIAEEQQQLKTLSSEALQLATHAADQLTHWRDQYQRDDQSLRDELRKNQEQQKHELEQVKALSSREIEALQDTLVGLRQSQSESMDRWHARAAELQVVISDAEQQQQQLLDQQRVRQEAIRKQLQDRSLATEAFQTRIQELIRNQEALQTQLQDQVELVRSQRQDAVNNLERHLQALKEQSLAYEQQQAVVKDLREELEVNHASLASLREDQLLFQSQHQDRVAYLEKKNADVSESVGSTITSMKQWKADGDQEQIALSQRSKKIQAMLEGALEDLKHCSRNGEDQPNPVLEQSYQQACRELSIDPSSPWEVVRETWRRNAKLWHPDLGGELEQWNRRQAAYRLLSAWYDFQQR